MTQMGAEKAVLLVEDNEDNRRIYSELLRLSGYRVIEATDGLAGVEEARAHLPDLILMDISMPRLDGWGAIEILKRDGTTAGIPVMAITAHVSLEGERERARQVGFEEYLVKPLIPKDLLRIVEARLGAAR
jgi:two-component system, cell cycle response regulator DivK